MSGRDPYENKELLGAMLLGEDHHPCGPTGAVRGVTVDVRVPGLAGGSAEAVQNQ